MQAQAEEYRENMIDAISMFDDELAEKFLGGEEISVELIKKAIRNGSRDNLTAMVLRITSNRSKSILSRFSLGGYLHLYQLLPVMLVSAAVLLLLILILSK